MNWGSVFAWFTVCAAIFDVLCGFWIGRATGDWKPMEESLKIDSVIIGVMVFLGGY